MPKGVYARSKKEFDRVSVLGRKHTSTYNISAEHRELARKQRIKFNKSDGSRQRAKLMGEKYGTINIIKRNKSKKGRETSRKNILKIGGLTQSQKILSKVLTDNDIHNHMEHIFPTIRRRGDIAVPSSKLIIEVDGSSHKTGMFMTKEQKHEDDILKEKQIKSLGWKILRVTNEEVNNNLIKIIKKIEEEL